MCTEYPVREYYNEMYRIHTQPDNGYDAGDDLYHLTVHKHLDQDPLTQFREAFGWVDQSRARLIADAGCGYGGGQNSAIKPVISTAAGVPTPAGQQLVAHDCKSRGLVRHKDGKASSGTMMRLSPLNRSVTPQT
jgi:hypothetical protein